jgi:RHS repeat-associated protein
VIDPKGLTTSYDYNGLGDLVELDSPDTGSTTYTYDEAGNRASQTDARGITSLYDYDALGRLTGIDLPTPGQDLGFGYDAAPAGCAVGETFAAGRLSGFTDPSGSTDYCYDRRGNVLRKVQSNGSGGTPATVRYSYNHADRLVSMTYPSGAIVTYGRDAAGRITGVMARPTATAAETTLVSDVDYLPFGPATRLTFGNGRTLDRSYDANYGIDAVTDSAVDGVDLDYTLDAIGNVTGLAERQASGTTASRTIDYDALDRLTALKDGATTVQGFSYDATGNRLSRTEGSTETYTYPTDNHRLAQVGAMARNHDAAGNTLSLSASRSFTYDDRGRMAQFLVNGATSREYRYNARGERVAKLNVPSPQYHRYYVYDEAGRLLGEYRPNGTRVAEYVWLDDTLVAVFSTHGDSNHQLVLTDHLGTPRAIVHPTSNAIVWRWDLTPSAFGDHAAQTDPDGDGTGYTFNLRYPGQYYDAETGLHYNYFRDYDPSTGRYVQSDPIGLGGGLSTFAYVGGRPFGSTDPLGLFAPEEQRPPVRNPITAPVPQPKPATPGLLSRALPYLRGVSGPMLALWPSEIAAPACEMPGGPPCGDAYPETTCPMPDDKCPPCVTVSGRVVTPGTLGYRPLDAIPDNVMQHGVYGSHHNIFRANQYPKPKCDCFWAKQSYVLKPNQLPPNAVPVEPFVN